MEFIVLLIVAYVFVAGCVVMHLAYDKNEGFTPRNVRRVILWPLGAIAWLLSDDETPKPPAT